MSLVETYLRAQPGRFGLWPSVGRLLRLRVRIWWNALKRSKLRNKIGTGVLVALLAGLMVFLFIASGWLLQFLHSPRLAELIDPVPFLAAIPTLVLTMAFILVILTNFGLLLQALYLSRDMDFLVTAPIPMRAVFLAKLLEAILPNFALFCAFSLPVLFGLGFSSGYSLLYYPLLVAMLALLALAAGGLASILVMAVVRVIPAKRVAEVLGVLGALASVLCGQSGNLMNALDVKRTDLTGALNLFTRLNTPWSPLAWAGRGLTAVGRGEWPLGLGLSALSLLLAGLLFTGTLYLAEQLYYTGWSSMQGSVGRRRGAKKQATVTPAGMPVQAAASLPIAPDTMVRKPARLGPAPLRGLIIKDLLILRRDPRNMSQMITPMILGIAMLFTTRGRGPSQALAGVRLPNMDQYILIALALFVGWMLMFNLATVAFSREGRNYWMLKSAPIRPAYLMGSKFVVSFVPAAIFSLVYLALAYAIRGMDYAYYAYSGLVVTLILAGSTGLSLAFGTAGANFDWDSPNRQGLRGWSGCLVAIAVAGFMLVDLLLFLAPPLIGLLVTGGTTALTTGLGLALGGVASIVGMLLPPWLVMPRLATLGEPG